MMPQKRNLDVAELIRGKTGRVFGSLIAMLTILKGRPSGYNRDMQEDKIHIFSSSDTIEACLDMAFGIISNMKFNVTAIAAGLEEGFLDATALAEYLVKKGIPFRQAHGIVGQLVAKCEKETKKLRELNLDELKQACTAIEQDVLDSLGASNVANSYVTEGAAGPNQAKRQIRYWTKQLGKR